MATQDPINQGCLTHFETSGTHYEVGYNTAAKFSDRIQLFFRHSQTHQQKLLPFFDSRVGRDFYEESLRVTQDCFPQYVREVRGMADGAGLPFERVFMANVFERNVEMLVKEKDTAAQQLQQEATGSVDEYGCTTLFIHAPDTCTQLLLHNEDCDPLVKKYGFLLTANVKEGEVEERFTSFSYPGSLPGRAFSFNQHGVVFTSNALYPAKAVWGAPSRVFSCRSLVSARDVQDAVRLARNAPYGCAYGFSVNLCTREGHMTSLEVGPGKPEAQVHVHDVTKHDDPHSSRHYYHFNMYKHLKVPEGGDMLSSKGRAQRASQLAAPRTLQQALSIVGDTHEPVAPIFRTPRASDRGETACTAVFDVAGGQVLLYGDRESLLGDTPALKLPLYR